MGIKFKDFPLRAANIQFYARQKIGFEETLRALRVGVKRKNKSHIIVTGTLIWLSRNSLQTFCVVPEHNTATIDCIRSLSQRLKSLSPQ